MEILILAYLLSSVLSVWLLIHTWRFDFDVTRTDIVFFVGFSLFGPISLTASMILYLIAKISQSDSPAVFRQY